MLSLASMQEDGLNVVEGTEWENRETAVLCSR